MTEPPHTPGHDPLLDEALDWIVRLKTGEPTQADLDALRRWRQQSAAHEEAFKTAARVYRRAGAAARELGDQELDNAAAIPRRPRLLARRALLAGTIAAAAGYVIVRPPLQAWPSLEELSADYRTRKGEQRKIAVAPDVSLELNTLTGIALRTAPNEIRLELVYGEALVTAQTLTSMPLVMLAGGGRVTASKANFNARCLDGIVAVACLEGTVTVEQGGRVVQLPRNQQVTYTSAGLEPSVTVDAAQISAWQTGLLVFRDRPLADVVDEINRYRSGKIIILSADLKRRIVNGTFQLDKLDNFVAQVEQLFGAKITQLPGGLVFMA